MVITIDDEDHWIDSTRGKFSKKFGCIIYAKPLESKSKGIYDVAGAPDFVAGEDLFGNRICTDDRGLLFYDIYLGTGLRIASWEELTSNWRFDRARELMPRFPEIELSSDKRIFPRRTPLIGGHLDLKNIWLGEFANAGMYGYMSSACSELPEGTYVKFDLGGEIVEGQVTRPTTY